LIVKIKKLDIRGMTHAVILGGFLVIFAVVGVGYLVATHAASIPMAMDLAQPECGMSINGNAINQSSYAMIGVNTTTGIWSNNSCARAEASHFSNYSLYLVPNYPSATCTRLHYSTPYACGAAAAHYSAQYAASQGLRGSQWWIDTESGAHWGGSTTDRINMLKGVIQGLKDKRASFIGFYANLSDWASLTGNWHNGYAFWIAEGGNQGLTVSQAQSLAPRIKAAWCGKATGGPNYWVQVEGGVSGIASGRIDVSFSCR
jgi:hypothetical protein